ncbi:hypothetical protein J1605_006914 [Eschrichtius robustus]|uniref:Uncharacterized protein n=1 Tax=Eschrichtius robustus TaxID=9764 RepID=A0AB34H2U5_ESCRO|nr:hypothetical protein J1605_006914 [Eschrichtius robustus]
MGLFQRPPRDHLLLAGEEEEEDARSLDAVHGRGPGSWQERRKRRMQGAWMPCTDEARGAGCLGSNLHSPRRSRKLWNLPASCCFCFNSAGPWSASPETPYSSNSTVLVAALPCPPISLFAAAWVLCRGIKPPFAITGSASPWVPGDSA